MQRYKVDFMDREMGRVDLTLDCLEIVNLYCFVAKQLYLVYPVNILPPPRRSANINTVSLNTFNANRLNNRMH